MARELGRYFRVYAGDAASPEVFTLVAGQTGLTRDASSNLVDQSNKGDYPYAIQAPGRANFTITCTGKRVLPDASGLELVYTSFKNQTTRNFKIGNSVASPVVYPLVGEFYVTSFSQDDPDEDNGSFSFVLTPAAAPTVDDLTP